MISLWKIFEYFVLTKLTILIPCNNNLYLSPLQHSTIQYITCICKIFLFIYRNPSRSILLGVTLCLFFLHLQNIPGFNPISEKYYLRYTSHRRKTQNLFVITERRRRLYDLWPEYMMCVTVSHCRSICLSYSDFYRMMIILRSLTN